MSDLLTSDTGSWYTSRTLWIAFIVFVCSALKAGGINVPLIEEGSANMNMILSVIFAILRTITKKPING